MNMFDVELWITEFQNKIFMLNDRIKELELEIFQIMKNDLANLEVEKRLIELENNCLTHHPIKLSERVKDIEYRLEHIVELPTELDIRLQDVERILDKSIDKTKEVRDRLSEVEKNQDRIPGNVVNRVSNLEEFINKNWILKRREPHKCPVCDGNGRIKLSKPLVVDHHPGQSTFFSMNCIACEEKGIVWG